MKTRAPAVSALVALGVVLSGTILAAPHAAAALGTITCALGTNVVQFDPGLTYAVQDTRITGQGLYTGCVATDPHITSGRSTIVGRGKLNCLTSDGSTVEKITWNTGEKSTVEYSFGVIVQPAGEAVAVVTGTVTEGKFAGSLVASPGALTTLNPLACSTPTGVQEIGGPVLLSLISL
ncbi:hypothetical protein LVJ94_51465 [Pendulispora rubella]|uniref:Secreted protein n=1 Tax=Pendulispora rubella TaxID=2741070 RepID=A0ABZ2L4P0_9BACT